VSALGEFIGELDLRAISPEALKLHPESNGGRKQLWICLSPFTYVSKKHGTITMEQGFVSDLASIPWFGRSFIDDDDPNVLRPSMPHDVLYQYAGKLPDGRIFTRRQADDILLEGMEVVGAPERIKRTVITAVRLFGGRLW
jgi:hypothetical protein